MELRDQFLITNKLNSFLISMLYVSIKNKNINMKIIIFIEYVTY